MWWKVPGGFQVGEWHDLTYIFQRTVWLLGRTGVEEGIEVRGAAEILQVMDEADLAYGGSRGAAEQ